MDAVGPALDELGQRAGHQLAGYRKQEERQVRVAPTLGGGNEAEARG